MMFRRCYIQFIQCGTIQHRVLNPGQESKTFLAHHVAGHWRQLLASVAALDVLAGFAVATRPEAAPPGCAFCRPVFISAQEVLIR